MIIHPAAIREQNDEVLLRAQVSFERATVPMPDTLWFALPRDYAGYLTRFADPFVAALFQFAMLFDEPLQVEGTISESLAENLPGIAASFQRAFPNVYHPLQFPAPTTATRPPGGDAVGMTFSGGLDSLHTLRLHTPPLQSDPAQQISHLIFVEGFDARLDEVGHLALARANFQQLAQELGLTLLPVRTNVYSFFEYLIDWGVGHHPALLAFPLLFDGLLRDFYIATGNLGPADPESWLASAPRYSHPGLRIHDPYQGLRRIDKFPTIQDWPVAWHHLRLCSKHTKVADHLNCGECGKCVPWMVYLEIEGELKSFTTFANPFSFRLLPLWMIGAQGSLRHITLLIAHARQRRRWKIMVGLMAAYLPAWASQYFYVFRKKAQNLLPLHLRHALKRRFFPPNESKSAPTTR